MKNPPKDLGRHPNSLYKKDLDEEIELDGVDTPKK
jgi:hypothetical protein